MDTDDQEIDFYKLGKFSPEFKAILEYLVKEYQDSSDADVLQDGVVVSFDNMAKAAHLDRDKIVDEVFKAIDAPKNEITEQQRSYIPLVQSCMADEKAQEFRIVVNPHLFDLIQHETVVKLLMDKE